MDFYMLNECYEINKNAIDGAVEDMIEFNKHDAPNYTIDDLVNKFHFRDIFLIITCEYISYNDMFYFFMTSEDKSNWFYIAAVRRESFLDNPLKGVTYVWSIFYAMIQKYDLKKMKYKDYLTVQEIDEFIENVKKSLSSKNY